MKQQTQIGNKNHNIKAYIEKAFKEFHALNKKYPDNEEFEKLNY